MIKDACFRIDIFLARSDIVNRGVQYIIDSVIQALLDNPDRRYIYVEMAYFWRWWNEQSDDMRNVVKGLVNEGVDSGNLA